MLPSNLLIARRWKNQIKPVYAKLTQENIEIADQLIQIYRKHRGSKKYTLKELLAEKENLYFDYRFIRGLSVLLDRRCDFHSENKVDSIKIRRKLFEITSRKGIPFNRELRRQIIHEAALEFNLGKDEIESAIYSDLDDELILKEFASLKAEQLLLGYNLGLTQTLLFHSTEMQFTTSGNWQQIFRQVKKLRLIYDAWKIKDAVWIKIDGPLSLFKLNRRYGTSIAKLLPTIITNDKWIINSKILRNGSQSNKYLLNCYLNSDKDGRLMNFQQKQSNLADYDSEIEQNFALNFESLKTGWILRREPEPIPLENSVMIPDFSFEKEGTTVYMEIVGFWTSDYLKRKVKKLQQLGNHPMIIAVNKELACESITKLKDKMTVIYFKNKIPLRPILEQLREIEKKLRDMQIESVSIIDLHLKKPVVELNELADTLGVLEKTAREILHRKKIPGYLFLTNILIKPSKLKEIQEALEKQEAVRELDLLEASKVIGNLGGVKPTEILETLGYKIKWQGLDPRKAKITKKSRIKVI